MKQTEIIVLGLAGLAVYLIWKSQQTRVIAPRDTGKPANFVDQIFDIGGGAFSNGWKYYENGTAIDPKGNYYFDGALVYQAPGSGA